MLAPSMTTAGANSKLQSALLESADIDGAIDALRQGAEVRARFFDGSVPLTWAVSGSFGPEGSARLVRSLLKHGARVEDETLEFYQTKVETSVHRAAGLGYLDALSELLSADGRVALERYDSTDRSPLICAVVGGSIPTAQLLLDAGARVDASNEARAGNSALRWATEEKSEEMVRFLLAAGANPLKPGWMQISALQVAAKWKDSTRHPELRRIHDLLDRVARNPGSRHELSKKSKHPNGR